MGQWRKVKPTGPFVRAVTGGRGGGRGEMQETAVVKWERWGDAEGVEARSARGSSNQSAAFNGRVTGSSSRKRFYLCRAPTAHSSDAAGSAD